jgi:hypothetical protein
VFSGGFRKGRRGIWEAEKKVCRRSLQLEAVKARNIWRRVIIFLSGTK